MNDTPSKISGRKALADSREHATSSRSHDTFGGFATTASNWLGSKWAFIGAILIIVGWGASGPFFHFSDTWQLVINTGTTVVTFLMVFLIQNTQNRDARAINLKLNELILAIDAAGDQMLDIETLGDDELEAMHKRYERIREECLRREGQNPKSHPEHVDS
jgi:low affinity Fe/Cu permease